MTSAAPRAATGNWFDMRMMGDHLGVTGSPGFLKMTGFPDWKVKYDSALGGLHADFQKQSQENTYNVHPISSLVPVTENAGRGGLAS